MKLIKMKKIPRATCDNSVIERVMKRRTKVVRTVNKIDGKVQIKKKEITKDSNGGKR